MTQEEKELLLLLKDLCARLPYGVQGVLCDDDTWTLDRIWTKKGYESVVMAGDYYDIEDFKPYLFPLSSMTEEQSKTYHELIGGMFGTSALINFEVLEDFFHKNHLDYRGLIPMGLAIDATNKNIY